MKNSIIKQLSDECINKIAAGEVIERPASVVKELIENAIDAEATDISVTIKEGGKSYIKISDNGSGIDPTSLDICFNKHTTSKINNPEDIFNIDTTGFRGEALSSIAAIAEVKMTTKTADANLGYEIILKNGKIIEKNEIARNQGTSCTIENLFHNVPARKNFLSSAQGETTRITDIFTRLTLAHHEIRFSLKQGNKEIFNSNMGSLQNRITDVFGAKLSAIMLPIEYEDNYMKLHGVIAPPEACKGRRTRQYFYLNKRPIFNPMIAKALSRAYESLNPGKYPPAVLYLSLKNGEFDINVHPTKKEVRFSNESLIFTSIVRAIKDTLTESMHEPVFKIETHSELDYTNMPHENFNDTNLNLSIPSFEQFKSSDNLNCSKNIAEEDFSYLGESQDLFDSSTDIINLTPENYQSAAETRKRSSPLAPLEISLYQLANKYIVTEDTNNLIFINQNAAHQRILYDEALSKLENSEIEINSQQLLFPIDMEFTPAEYNILENSLDLLNRLAFYLEPFGQNCFKLRGMPIDINITQAEDTIRTILSDIEDNEELDQNYHKKMAKAYAQGAAINNGAILNSEKMNIIVHKLFMSSNPMSSPSGYPTMHKQAISDIDKKFKAKGIG